VDDEREGLSSVDVDIDIEEDDACEGEVERK